MTRVIAHRGSGPFGPELENTVAAFQAAGRLGADGVELDVRRSADRHLVVNHDATTASGAVICELGASELPSHIPSLAEAMDACGPLRVNVEVKNAEADQDYDPTQWVARETARVLSERGVPRWESDGGVVVSSFSREALRAIREVAEQLELAWIVGLERWGSDLVGTASSDGLDGLHPYDWLVDEALVAAAAAVDLPLRVWTVNDGARVAQLADFAVESVVSNDVPLALAALSGRRLAKEAASREQSGT